MEIEYLNLLRLFHAEHVEYVIVGGYAVIAHGFPRTTGDMDLLVQPRVENARRVVRALTRYGFPAGKFKETDFTTTPASVPCRRQELWIDLLTEIRGASFEECATDALVTKIEGLPVRYSNLGALRKAKAATARPQDLLNLENLPTP